MNSVTRAACLIFGFYGLTLYAKQETAGEQLNYGLYSCNMQRLEAFYTFLQENEIEDFDYTKNAKKFFKCGGAATKLWAEKGNGKQPVDINKNVSEWFPNFYYHAFEENNVEAVEELLKHSDPNTIQKVFEESDNGGRLTLFAKSFSCPLKYLELFVKHGASIKNRMILTKSGFSMEKEKIRKLIHLGADINEKNSEGNTTIMLMFKESFNLYLNILEELLAHNPDLTIKNNKGKTVLEMAQDQVQASCASDSKSSYKCEEFTKALAHLKRHQEQQAKKA
ncbi:hypothetical protein BH09DEP1_BH09DEP1_1550 [soil metagenome]